jgi:acylglycerol lipase
MSESVESNIAWLQGPENHSFYTHTYAPSNGTPLRGALLFVHGFIEHIERYGHVFPVWAKHGFGVFAYDQRGFGRTALGDKKSDDAAYGKTSLVQQMQDLTWAAGEAQKKFPGVPLFLMGHSMGGGEVLAYCTKNQNLPFTGTISTSPLIQQAKPVFKLIRTLGSVAAKFTPYLNIPADVKKEDISRDPKVGEAYVNDPLVQFHGTLRGVGDMLDNGDWLLSTGYKTWPKTLPLLMIHGTGDRVTSYRASEQFYNSVVADDKHISLYEGGYHELHNEPDGMTERLINEAITWAEKHLPS